MKSDEEVFGKGDFAKGSHILGDAKVPVVQATAHGVSKLNIGDGLVEKMKQRVHPDVKVNTGNDLAAKLKQRVEADAKINPDNDSATKGPAETEETKENTGNDLAAKMKGRVLAGSPRRVQIGKEAPEPPISLKQHVNKVSAGGKYVDPATLPDVANNRERHSPALFSGNRIEGRLASKNSQDRLSPGHTGVSPPESSSPAATIAYDSDGSILAINAGKEFIRYPASSTINKLEPYTPATNGSTSFDRWSPARHSSNNSSRQSPASARLTPVSTTRTGIATPSLLTPTGYAQRSTSLSDKNELHFGLSPSNKDKGTLAERSSSKMGNVSPSPYLYRSDKENIALSSMSPTAFNQGKKENTGLTIRERRFAKLGAKRHA